MLPAPGEYRCEGRFPGWRLLQGGCDGFRCINEAGIGRFPSGGTQLFVADTFVGPGPLAIFRAWPGGWHGAPEEIGQGVVAVSLMERGGIADIVDLAF